MNKSHMLTKSHGRGDVNIILEKYQVRGTWNRLTFQEVNLQQGYRAFIDVIIISDAIDDAEISTLASAPFRFWRGWRIYASMSQRDTFIHSLRATAPSSFASASTEPPIYRFAAVLLMIEGLVARAGHLVEIPV